jgi:ketosteroid isomerase-like protein
VALVLPAVIAANGCRFGFSRSSDLNRIGQQWLEAWNEHRGEKLLDLFENDVIFSWPTMKMPTRGKRETGDYFEFLWKSWRNVELRSHTITSDESSQTIALDWSLSAIDAASGNPIHLDGVEILRLRNGRIIADRGIFNTCELLAQLKKPTGDQDATPGTNTGGHQ